VLASLCELGVDRTGGVTLEAIDTTRSCRDGAAAGAEEARATHRHGAWERTLGGRGERGCGP
jgi:hypothetical protein